MFNSHKIYKLISPLFRRKRRDLFLKTMKPGKETRILDVGGFSWHWKDSGVESQITLLNLKPLEEEALRDHPQFTFRQGDGCHLPFDDGEFDLVYSNSVIEHLYEFKNQESFARETQRVGKDYWIQTPAREFPIEPHLLGAFIHWLPRRPYLWGAKWLTLRSYMRDTVCPTRQDVVEMAKEVRLLRKKEFAALYPDGDLHVERFLGFRKSYIAYKKSD